MTATDPLAARAATPASATPITPITPTGWSAAITGGDHAQLRTHVSELVTIAAQGPLDAAGRLLHHEDPIAQAALALANVEAVLAAAGMGIGDLAHLDVHVVQTASLDDVVETIAERLAAAGASAPLTVAAVAGLLTPGAVVQIGGLAAR